MASIPPLLVAVVDDDEAVRMSTERLLRRSGYGVDTYASGVDFLRDAAALRYDCILLDVRMPVMDGLSVLRVLRAQPVPVAPIIVLTGHGDIPLAVEAIKLGAEAFLEKPYDPAALTSSIQNAIDGPVGPRE